MDRNLVDLFATTLHVAHGDADGDHRDADPSASQANCGGRKRKGSKESNEAVTKRIRYANFEECSK